MACMTVFCSAIPAGRAMIAAVIAGAMIQQVTMVMDCLGVIPSALKMPRSWTRSRVSMSTEFSTPSPASIATIMVSSRIREVSTSP